MVSAQLAQSESQLQDRETIGRLVAALSGPLNILATIGSPSIAELKLRISFSDFGFKRRFSREQSVALC